MIADRFGLCDERSASELNRNELNCFVLRDYLLSFKFYYRFIVHSFNHLSERI